MLQTFIYKCSIWYFSLTSGQLASIKISQIFRKPDTVLFLESEKVNERKLEALFSSLKRSIKPIYNNYKNKKKTPISPTNCFSNCYPAKTWVNHRRDFFLTLLMFQVNWGYRQTILRIEHKTSCILGKASTT